MPHALSMPSPGFQAVILCGPGVSLTTFTANPEDFPKALVPIANRPMVWYPLDWCYRMGVTSKRIFLNAVFLLRSLLGFLNACTVTKVLKREKMSHYSNVLPAI